MNEGAVHYLPLMWYRIHAATGGANGVQGERESLLRDHNHPYIAIIIKSVPIILLIGLQLGRNKYRVRH